MGVLEQMADRGVKSAQEKLLKNCKEKKDKDCEIKWLKELAPQKDAMEQFHLGMLCG